MLYLITLCRLIACYQTKIHQYMNYIAGCGSSLPFTTRKNPYCTYKNVLDAFHQDRYVSYSHNVHYLLLTQRPTHLEHLERDQNDR